MARILIAEDETSLRVLVARALAQDSHEITTAHDGAEALDTLTRAAGELELWAETLAQAAAQFFQDAAGALDIDLARHLHGDVVAVVAAAQRTAERVGLLLRARLAELAGPSRARDHLRLVALLQHRLRE